MNDLMSFDNSPADVLSYLLIALGQATDPTVTTPADLPAPTWPAFVTKEPDQPDSCITVKDTVGRSHGRSMIDGEVWYHHGFQVRVRSGDHPTGWAKLNAMRAFLAKTVYANQLTLPGSAQPSGHTYLIHCINNIGPVIPLGYDNPQSKRELFTLNAMIVLKQLA
jgi:hypothetical protein